jgi:hypothetical protein
MTSEPFLPWHSDFGRTVATDVALATESDEVRFLLRYAIVYETDQGTAMALRIEILHSPSVRDESEEATRAALDSLRRDEDSIRPGEPVRIQIPQPDLTPEQRDLAREAFRQRREGVPVTVDGQAAHRMGGSDDGFRSVGDYWVAPAPEGEFTLTVSYARVSAAGVVR